MGNEVSILESIFVTVFSITVVFIVLIAIAYLIGFLKTISKERTGKTVEEPVLEVFEAQDKDEVKSKPTNEVSEEIIAVIAAAIAASLTSNMPNLKIKTIRRVDQNINQWSDTGRKVQILSRL